MDWSDWPASARGSRPFGSRPAACSAWRRLAGTHRRPTHPASCPAHSLWMTLLQCSVLQQVVGGASLWRDPGTRRHHPATAMPLHSRVVATCPAARGRALAALSSSLPSGNGHLRCAQLAVGAAGGQQGGARPCRTQHLVGVTLQRVQGDGCAQVPQLCGAVVRCRGHVVRCRKGRWRGGWQMGTCGCMWSVCDGAAVEGEQWLLDTPLCIALRYT